MALTMYMKVTGKNQGEIKGSCDQGGDKKDKILVYAMDHKVEIPKDTHTGLPTGQRIHHPLTVTKAKDVASPKLFAACCKGEQVDVELDFYRIKPTGEEELYYKITINDAVIVEMGENTPTLTVILSSTTTGRHKEFIPINKKKIKPHISSLVWGFLL